MVRSESIHSVKPYARKTIPPKAISTVTDFSQSSSNSPSASHHAPVHHVLSSQRKSGGVRKRKQNNPQNNLQALRKLTRYDTELSSVIPILPFARVVKEIMNRIAEEKAIGVHRIQTQAINALQMACEAMLIQYFEDLQTLAVHAGRKTIMAKDVTAWHKLIGSRDASISAKSC